jgi:SHAQKYF class myb-like DNA-binding protein
MKIAGTVDCSLVPTPGDQTAWIVCELPEENNIVAAINRYLCEKKRCGVVRLDGSMDDLLYLVPLALLEEMLYLVPIALLEEMSTYILQEKSKTRHISLAVWNSKATPSYLSMGSVEPMRSGNRASKAVDDTAVCDISPTLLSSSNEEPVWPCSVCTFNNTSNAECVMCGGAVISSVVKRACTTDAVAVAAAVAAAGAVAAAVAVAVAGAAVAVAVAVESRSGSGSSSGGGGSSGSIHIHPRSKALDPSADLRQQHAPPPLPSPPLPSPPPPMTGLTNAPKVYTCLVESGILKSKHKCVVSACTLRDFTDALARSLELTDPAEELWFEIYDHDFGEYIVLDDMGLVGERAKLKVNRRNRRNATGNMKQQPAIQKGGAVANVSDGGSAVATTATAAAAATAATAAAAAAVALSSSASATGSTGTGTWTAHECALFRAGLQRFGRDWKKVKTAVTTRSLTQIRSHAQKYFKKVERGQKEPSTEGGMTKGGLTEGGLGMDGIDWEGQRLPIGTSAPMAHHTTQLPLGTSAPMVYCGYTIDCNTIQHGTTDGGRTAVDERGRGGGGGGRRNERGTSWGKSKSSGSQRRRVSTGQKLVVQHTGRGCCRSCTTGVCNRSCTGPH